jgi:hypothetical protein
VDDGLVEKVVDAPFIVIEESESVAESANIHLGKRWGFWDGGLGTGDGIGLGSMWGEWGRIWFNGGCVWEEMGKRQAGGFLPLLRDGGENVRVFFRRGSHGND